MASKFSMHGTLALSVQGRVLKLIGEGPWNNESLQLGDPEVMERVQSLYGSPWGVLGVFSGQAVYVPQAIEKLKRQVAQEVALGRVATAVVFNNVAVPELSKYQYEAMYQTPGHAVAFFSDQQAAEEWLHNAIDDALTSAKQNS